MVISFPTLYPHQEVMRDAVRQSLAEHRRSILCASPGTGKTRTAKWMLAAFANREVRQEQSGRALFAVHRRGLVDNAADSFNEDPVLPHGVIMSGRDTSPGCKVQVGSIDTINSWYCEGGQYNTDLTYDLVIFDETHSHVSKLRTFLEVHDAKRKQLGLAPTFVLGLSATPQHRELNKVYKDIVMGPTTEWLISNGYLSKFRYFQCTQGQLGLLVKKGDEYVASSVERAMHGMAGNLVDDWKKHAAGRATVGFFPLRQQAMEACRLLAENGIESRYVDAYTSDEMRRLMFRDLNEGRIDYLCNVGVVERGTDIPRISCVQLCTAVGSVVRYRQMIGRGSRVHPAKEDTIVLDHARNIRSHGFFEDEVEWTLEWGERPSKEHAARESINCPQCDAIYRGGACKSCGYEPTQRERRSQGLEFVGGELREIARSKSSDSKKSLSNEQILIRALYVAGRANLTFGQAWHIAKKMANGQGTQLRMPDSFEVAGVRYQTIPFRHLDSHRKVRDTYGFTVGNRGVDDNPYCLTPLRLRENK